MCIFPIDKYLQYYLMGRILASHFLAMEYKIIDPSLHRTIKPKIQHWFIFMALQTFSASIGLSHSVFGQML